MSQQEVDQRQDRERALRMLAVQILGQLPADQTEARMVLDHTRRLLDDFLHEPRRNERPSLCSVT